MATPNPPTLILDLPIVQGDIKRITGSPEAVLYAPMSYLVTDDTGRLWIKTTTHLLNTGWKQIQAT